MKCYAGGKVIVFAHHIVVLDGIQDKLGRTFNAHNAMQVAR